MKKRIIAALLVAALGLGMLSGCGENGTAKETAQSTEQQTEEMPKQPDPADEPEIPLKYDPTQVGARVSRIGMLSMLNMTPEGMGTYSLTRATALSLLAKEGYVWFPFQFDVMGSMQSGQVEIKFYDSLTEMQMALNAGEIDYMNCYKSVGDYLCSLDDSLVTLYMYDMNKERNVFADLMFRGILGNDFSFLMMEDRTELRDLFNAAISDMKVDGTMDRLVEEQITNVINGQTPQPVEMEKIDGAETIRVAVTGALPPMDYVSADGRPAGFNTAVLAEIGKRIGKNVELVVVDSIGRATALSSGNVDAVFWTRTSAAAEELANATEEEAEQQKEALQQNMTEEELACLSYIDSILDFANYGKLDIPDRTITTQSYYSDLITNVLTKKKQQEIMEEAAQ